MHVCWSLQCCSVIYPFENTATSVVPLISDTNGKAYAMLSTEILLHQLKYVLYNISVY